MNNLDCLLDLFIASCSIGTTVTACTSCYYSQLLCSDQVQDYETVGVDDLYYLYAFRHYVEVCRRPNAKKLASFVAVCCRGL